MKYYQYHDVNFRGTIEKVRYLTTNKEGKPREKYANVYLPKGYDHGNRAKRYNVLYLMHGGGGNPDAWLDCCKIKNMLDYCIDAGEIQPLIVVFPSYYKDPDSRVGKPHVDSERLWTLEFQPELPAELLPAVEGRYSTYAKTITPEGLKASREHRAFGGFSMGSCTTWYAFMNNLDYFANFLPLSGDCWAVQVRGGEYAPRETAKKIYEAFLNSGHTPEDFRIYGATGSEDPAFTALGPQMEALKAYTDVFHFSDDFSQGNLHYFVAEGQVHAYEAVYHYVYNYLPYLFQNGKEG